MADTRPQPQCPTCRVPVAWQGNPYRPFCSQRCRIIDLGDWAAERHRIPGESIPDDDDAPDGLPH
ncbi:MAG: DNA gyrase inhibitor YacG [Deltaproteobacteria bacterium]|nr:DNA gyrase inhibitor YacG [Deltaproteobacteria bacterium]